MLNATLQTSLFVDWLLRNIACEILYMTLTALIGAFLVNGLHICDCNIFDDARLNMFWCVRNGIVNNRLV